MRLENWIVCWENPLNQAESDNGESAHLSAWPLRRNSPNYKRSENRRANERCETKGPENVTLSKAYEHHGEPERRES